MNPNFKHVIKVNKTFLCCYFCMENNLHSDHSAVILYGCSLEVNSRWKSTPRGHTNRVAACFCPFLYSCVNSHILITPFTWFCETADTLDGYVWQGIPTKGAHKPIWHCSSAGCCCHTASTSSTSICRFLSTNQAYAPACGIWFILLVYVTGITLKQM